MVRKLNSRTSGFARPIEMIDTSPLIADTVKTTTCYMCACRCGIRVHLRDGRIRFIDGNPDHPVNRGVVCAKGSAGIMNHHSPARLSKPLLRTGDRGRCDFKEIEWEEALTLAQDGSAMFEPRSLASWPSLPAVIRVSRLQDGGLSSSGPPILLPMAAFVR